MDTQTLLDLIEKHGVPITLLGVCVVGLIMFFGFLGLTVRWGAKNVILPLVARHSRFLDDLTVALTGIKDSVGEFRGLLAKAECKALPGVGYTVNRRPPEASG